MTQTTLHTPASSNDGLKRQVKAGGRWSLIGIWLAASVLAVLSSSLNLSAAKLDGEYIPVGNDSFYHARRILDTAQDPKSFYEFDTRIHAPEGSLLPWPWGYDYALGWIVRGAMSAGISSDPMEILVWIPAVSVVFSLALIIVIARRLGLSNWLTALAALCMALAPTTQLLHGVGQIDHHYAELIFVLATLAAGMTWARMPHSASRAALLAVILGVAPAVHNGLFILQVPVLMYLLALWLQGRSAPSRASAAFAVALPLSTLAVLIPSTPFRLGEFQFYTLSWFHLYIASCSGILALLASTLARRHLGFAVLATAMIVMAVPILYQLGVVRSFFAATVPRLQEISEMKSPLSLAGTPGGRHLLSHFYSYLIWLAAPAAIACLVKCWREYTSPRLFFWISSLLGLLLLSSQLRMHYFGTFALYLPWLVLAQEYADARRAWAKRVFLLCTLALVLLYVPPLRHQLLAPMPAANDIAFENIRPIFRALRKACIEDPGVVLADNNAGHYIRYYTDCAVIANNFLLTPQHAAKIREIDTLYALSAVQLPAATNYVKYVLVRPLDITRAPDGGFRYRFFDSGSARLIQELLLTPLESIPSAYELLDEIRFADVENIPYARLFKVRTANARQTSLIDVVERQ